jgi:hypothetical protein
MPACFGMAVVYVLAVPGGPWFGPTQPDMSMGHFFHEVSCNLSRQLKEVRVATGS